MPQRRKLTSCDKIKKKIARTLTSSCSEEWNNELCEERNKISGPNLSKVHKRQKQFPVTLPRKAKLWNVHISLLGICDLGAWHLHKLKENLFENIFNTQKINTVLNINTTKYWMIHYYKRNIIISGIIKCYTAYIAKGKDFLYQNWILKKNWDHLLLYWKISSWSDATLHSNLSCANLFIYT